VINPPPQPRGPPPPLPPAPHTRTLLHSDKICEDGSMATDDLDLDTCAHNAFAAGATCIAHVPNGCWICDACTPIIDYPDGDLYELSADYSPPTPLAPPQPPAPAFYEVKADNSRCMSAVGDAITIVAGDAGSGDFGSGGAEGSDQEDDLVAACFEQASLAGKGCFAVWPSQSKCYICDTCEAKAFPGNTLYEWNRAYSPPSPPPPNPSAPPVAPEASPPPELCGSDSIAGEQKRFDFGGLMVDSGEEKGKRLGCEGNATSYVCQSVALSVVPGHPLCINNPDCIDVSEFKALAQDLFVTNLMDLLLELANAIAIFAAFYFASSSLLLITLFFDLYLTYEAIMVAYQIQPLAQTILDADCFNKLEEDNLRDALLDLRDSCDTIIQLGIFEFVLALISWFGGLLELREENMATLKRDSSRKSLKRSSSRNTDSVPPERSLRNLARTSGRNVAASTRNVATAGQAVLKGLRIGKKEEGDNEENDPDTLPMRGMLKLAALLIPAVLDIILSTLEFAIFTIDAWSDVEELVASINDKDPAWCVTISDTCQPLLEAEQVATVGFNQRCTDGIRCPNALIGIVLIPTAVIIVLILLFIFEWWKDLKHTWQGGHYLDKQNGTWWKDAKFYVEGEEPYYCEKKKEHQGKAYRKFRVFMKLDELDDLLNMIEKKITYPCRAGEDGMWAKKSENKVTPAKS